MVQDLEKRRALYVCTIAYTETVRIPGVSAAGATPELREFTAAADAEALYYGEAKCIAGVPANPLGPPSPVVITLAALGLMDAPRVVVDAGMHFQPDVPVVNVGGRPGRSVVTGQAVDDVEKIFVQSRQVGRELSKMGGYLILGESVPGGTTTALSLLLALGLDALGKVSSSMAINDHELKKTVALEGLAKAGGNVFRHDPLRAVQAVGDPMQAAQAGLAFGAAERVPVVLAGGSQMVGVLALIKAVHEANIARVNLSNLAIATTRWVADDPMADFKGLMAQIGPFPALAVNLDFSRSRCMRLRLYEKGLVKEGVGAGGSALAALLQMEISPLDLLAEIESVHEGISKRAGLEP